MGRTPCLFVPPSSMSIDGSSARDLTVPDTDYPYRYNYKLTESSIRDGSLNITTSRLGLQSAGNMVADASSIFSGQASNFTTLSTAQHTTFDFPFGNTAGACGSFNAPGSCRTSPDVCYNYGATHGAFDLSSQCQVPSGACAGTRTNGMQDDDAQPRRDMYSPRGTLLGHASYSPYHTGEHQPGIISRQWQHGYTSMADAFVSPPEFNIEIEREPIEDVILESNHPSCSFSVSLSRPSQNPRSWRSSGT